MPPIYAVSTRSPIERMLYTIRSFRLKSIIFRSINNNNSSVVVGAAAAAIVGFVSSLVLWGYCFEPPPHQCDGSDNDNDDHNRLSPLVQRLLSAVLWKRRQVEEDTLILEEEDEEESIDMTVMNHIGTCLCESVCFSVRAPRSLKVEPQNLQQKFMNDFPKTCIPVSSLGLKEGSENLKNYAPASTVTTTTTTMMKQQQQQQLFESKYTFCSKCGTHLFQTPIDGSRQMYVNVLCLQSDWIPLSVQNNAGVLQQQQQQISSSRGKTRSTKPAVNKKKDASEPISTSTPATSLNETSMTISTITTGGAGSTTGMSALDDINDHDGDEDWTTSMMVPPSSTTLFSKQTPPSMSSIMTSNNKNTARMSVSHNNNTAMTTTRTATATMPTFPTRRTNESILLTVPPDSNNAAAAATTTTNLSSSTSSGNGDWRLVEPSNYQSTTSTAAPVPTTSTTFRASSPMDRAEEQQRANRAVSPDQLLFYMRKHLDKGDDDDDEDEDEDNNVNDQSNLSVDE